MPAGYHIYDLIWLLPEEYGGMTSAMLYRCWQFEHFGVGESVTILTLHVGLDVDWAQEHVSTRWGISRNVRVRNIWQDLRQASDEALQQLGGIEPEGMGPAEQREGYEKWRPNTRQFRDNEGKVVRREHVRDDGSLVVLVGLDDDPRPVVLYNSAGVAIRRWPNTAALYLAWLDWVMDRRPAVLINEHYNISKFLWRASIPGVKTCQVVHGKHQKGHKTPFSEFNTRARMMQNLAGFDLVSVLTEWQMQDMRALGVATDNLRIMPNATQPVAADNAADPAIRPAGKGVMLAQMSKRKQIGHAIKAVAKTDDDDRVTLDLYGDGEERPALEALVDQLDAARQITFQGHVPGAGQRLDEYAFLLLTAKAEGQPLVILEAMAHGCIPICYDMRYGPRDIITDGVDGFLVPADDIGALTATIQKFLALPEDERQAMRQAAMQRARYFYPENNVRRWRVALEELMAQPPRRTVAYKKCHAFAESVEIVNGSCRIMGYLDGTREDIDLTSNLVVNTRKKSSFIKVPADLHRVAPTRALFTASFALAHLPLRNVDRLDFYLQPVGALWDKKTRVKHALPNRSWNVEGLRIYKTKDASLSFEPN